VGIISHNTPLLDISESHSRDDQEEGVAHKVISPENQPQLSQTMMGQYWLGKAKPE